MTIWSSASLITWGKSADDDIGFGLADKLRINYYDVEIFDQVLRRLEAEKGAVNDAEYFGFVSSEKPC